MGLFSSGRVDAAKKRADKEAARQRMFAGQAIETVKHAEARSTAAEQARMGVQGLLGAPGTFDLPGTSSGGGGAVPGATATGKGIFAAPTGPSAEAQAALKWGAGGHSTDLPTSSLGERNDILDPEAFAGETSKTAGFRMRSRLTSEAEQMLAREGEAWERLSSGTLGLISEGHAKGVREEKRAIKNAMAKGGSARKNAFNQAREMVSRERNNAMLVQQTWQANLDLDKQVRANAQAVQEGNDQYLNNLPGIRDSYQNTMNTLATTMATTVLPRAALGSQAGAQMGIEATLRKSTGFLEGFIGAGLSIVGGAMTGGATSLLGAGMSMIPGADKAAGAVGNFWGGVESRSGDLKSSFQAGRSGGGSSSGEFTPLQAKNISVNPNFTRNA